MVSTAAAEPETLVILNKKATPVYFNDGDTFRALAGPFAGPSNRLAGFNTLESYGSVHRWGKFEAKELYNLAKIATWNAQRVSERNLGLGTANDLPGQ